MAQDPFKGLIKNPSMQYIIVGIIFVDLADVFKHADTRTFNAAINFFRISRG
jgi:hypothetical protein